MNDSTVEAPLSVADQRRLDDLYERLRREGENFLGYPCNALFDYRPLYRFLAYPGNNLGDPFVASNYHLNTHDFEREVVATFAQLAHGPADSTWGYVTNGGTEGNMYGLFLARELFPDGVVYFSEDTHYSVNKIVRCLHLRNVMIRSDADGRIDLEDLREMLKIHRDVPPILFLNIGSTMKGAVDDLDGIHKVLRDLVLHRHYIHADAALSGMILPFVEQPQPWDFRSGVDSISVSGHKMIGSPIPCGVALAQKAHVDRIARSIEYVGTLDTTIPGSRNAITPLFLWYAFRTIGTAGFAQRVRECLELAEYTVERLTRAGRRAWRHRNSITVVFDRPSQAVISRWQLAIHGNIAHVITMPHVTRVHIDRLAEDIARETSDRVRGGTGVMKQITIVSEDRPGVVAEVSEVLAAAGVNIEDLSADTVGGSTVLILQVDRYDDALRALAGTAFHAVTEDALVVRIDDRPGELARIMRRFKDANVNLRSVRIIRRAGGQCFVALAAERMEEAMALVKDVLVT